MEYRERRFALPNIEICAQEWGEPGGIPVLALHGWLDNAASFDVLAPQLENVHLIALDCAGHGFSGHRSSYNIWEDVGELFAVADLLGWNEFALLGHSRGAIVSTLAAGTFPDRISHLAMLDGMIPALLPASEAPQQLARSIVELRRHRQRGFAIYPDVESALMVRQRSEIPISEDAAQRLIRRGLKTVEGGYTWRSDPQLKAASAFKLSEEHMDSFLESITASMLLVLAEEGIPRLTQRHQDIVKRYPKIHLEWLPGNHHLHMETEPTEKLAIMLNQFFHSEVQPSS